MKSFAVVSCLVATALAQFPPQPSGLKEAQHFQAINQPHLPKDTNVLQATRQFLDKFAELKALADAAPDPVPSGRQPQAPVVQQQQAFAPAPHRFAPQPAAAPRPVPAHPANQKFDVNSEIGKLLAAHHAANPTPAPAPAPRRHQAPVHQQQPQAFPTFQVQNTFTQHQAPRPQAPRPQAPRAQFTQAAVQQVANPNVVTHNQQGQLINPKRFSGPLAHTVPAGVSGRVQATQFTPEVAAAHRNLAQAHANILQQQARLPRPVQ